MLWVVNCKRKRKYFNCERDLGQAEDKKSQFVWNKVCLNFFFLTMISPSTIPHGYNLPLTRLPFTSTMVLLPMTENGMEAWSAKVRIQVRCAKKHVFSVPQEKSIKLTRVGQDKNAYKCDFVWVSLNYLELSILFLEFFVFIWITLWELINLDSLLLYLFCYLQQIDFMDLWFYQFHCSWCFVTVLSS